MSIIDHGSPRAELKAADKLSRLSLRCALRADNCAQQLCCFGEIRVYVGVIVFPPKSQPPRALLRGRNHNQYSIAVVD